MLKKIFIVSVIVLAFVSVSCAGGAPDMKEGRWEISTKTEMPGMPMSIPTMKHTQCLTKKDLIPQNNQPGNECKITTTSVAGNTVTWNMQCSGNGADMEGRGSITYSGNSFKGKIEITMSKTSMKMISHISGHRIGDCK